LNLPSVCPIFSDTLIIDLDTIYVEQEQVQLPEDSIPTPQVNRSKRKIHPWSFALPMGMNLTHASIQPNSGSFLPLNDFTGMPYRAQPNVSTGLELGYRFLEIPASRGEIELSVLSAYSLNKVKIGYSEIGNPTELNKDSLLFFKQDAGDLLLGYFSVTEPPFIGEADSSYLSLTKSLLDYRSNDITLKLRASISRGPRRMRFFFETGIVRRFVKMNNREGEFYFLNENGQYHVLNSLSITGRNLIVPQFAIGAEKRMNSNGANQDHYFTIGGTIQTSFPSAAFYSDDLINVEVRNTSALLFARYFF
jgi:hypothetical protein